MKTSPPTFSRLMLPAFAILFVALLAACGNSSPNSSTSSTPTPAPTTTPADNVPKIVAFGDSLTAGYGLQPQESYPALLQKMLDADGFKYEVLNAGVSGDTSSGGVRRIDWSLDAGNVRFLILELGANDFLRGQPVSETKKNLAAIIERAKSRGVKVLLAGMLTTSEFGRGYEAEIRDAFQSLAKEQEVTLIPFFLEGVAGKDELNQQDRIHPNPQGTRIVAANVYKYLKPMLEQEQKK